MKIAVPATSNPIVDLDIFDEINLTYTESHKIEDFIMFQKKHSNKRINIFFKSDIDLKLLSIINKKIYVRLSYEQMPFQQKLEEMGVKYFYDYPIDSYVKLRYFLDKTNVTDVYITDDLCYNLENVFELCKKKGISIRMVLNRIPSTFEHAGELYDSPIFRPQDFDILNKYISTAEFDCFEGEKYKWNEFKILCKRWFLNKNWNEDLSIINKDVKFDFQNDSVPNGYGLFRSNCRHRCMTRVGTPCSKCHNFIFYSKI